MTWMMPIEDVLAPVLEAPPDDDKALAEAVNQVAETLAFMGVQFQDHGKKIVHGVTDEDAVYRTLRAYAKQMEVAGRSVALVEAGLIMNRVRRLKPPSRVKGAI